MEAYCKATLTAINKTARLRIMGTDVLEQWVVYDHPKDFPNHFVARRWEIGRGCAEATAEVIKAKTLTEIHERLPRGLVRLARHQSDDPVVVEVWT